MPLIQRVLPYEEKERFHLETKISVLDVFGGCAICIGVKIA
jgi:hypothetical protein